MALTTHLCAYCSGEFTGRPQAKYCGDRCRWLHHANAAKFQQELGIDKQEALDMAKAPKDPEASRRGRSNRAKGARAEREVCHLIHGITGDDVSRNLTQTRDAGGDVKWGPFYFEVKYQKTIAMPAWQQQAVISAAEDPDNLCPAVVYRRPGEKFWVSLPFETFLMMFDTLRKAAEANRE